MTNYADEFGDRENLAEWKELAARPLQHFHHRQEGIYTRISPLLRTRHHFPDSNSEEVGIDGYDDTVLDYH